MKTASILSLLTMVFLMCSPAAAEFYRYEDEHGNVIFTDDLSKVPVEKRASAQSYDDAAETPKLPTRAKETANDQQKSDTLEAIRAEGDRLQSVREELDKEYNALSEENTKLREEQKAAVTPEQIRQVNKKVVSFNTRFQAYQKRSDAYKAQLEAYNQRVEAAESERQQ